MPRKHIETNKDIKSRATELRRNMTDEERKLWYSFLCDMTPKFQRQRAFGHYIVDFFCAKCKLAIELDGSQHFDEKALEYDLKRTQYLNSIGIDVMRFTNKDINTNFHNVCETIYSRVCSD
ncbi:MAG: endonuclease domain-containing protein [Candidatus Ornithomonoglobus sp.]